MKTVGVVIGRFQLPELHNGHKSFINHVLASNDTACVLVGVTDYASEQNLLPYPAVAQMLRGVYREQYTAAKLYVLPLMDNPGDNVAWSKQIDTLLRLVFPKDRVTLYSGRDGFKPHYSGKHHVTDWYGYDGTVSGSDVRDKIINGGTIDSKDFRAGIIYGVGNYLRR